MKFTGREPPCRGRRVRHVEDHRSSPRHYADGGKSDDQDGIDRNLALLTARHLEAAKELVPTADLDRVNGEIADLVGEFRRIVNGMQMLGYRPVRAVDEAIAVGERLSALIVSEHLRSRALNAEAVNAAQAIVTDAVFNNASPLMDATREKAQARLLPILRAGGIPIVTGFNGATVDGRCTTLGRGGSDFSASILAAALDATELWIWTDVDGIMTADPRLVPDAKILTEITYSEAAEPAWAERKVLHPRTICAAGGARHSGSGASNSFAPEKPGTRIVPELTAGNSGAKGRHVDGQRGAGFCWKREPVRRSVAATLMSAVARCARPRGYGNSRDVEFELPAEISAFLVRNDEIEKSVEAIQVALSLEFAHGYVGNDIAVDCVTSGLLAVVGEGMRGTQGRAGRASSPPSRGTRSTLSRSRRDRAS